MASDIQAGLLLATQLFQFSLQRFRFNLDSAAIADLDRALIPCESNGTSPQRLHPARTFTEWSLEEIQHELYSVRVASCHVGGRRLVLHWHGVISLVGPLAEVHGVGAPVQQPAAGVEIPVATPAALHVTFVVRPPRRWPEPQVPVHHVARRRGLRW